MTAPPASAAPTRKLISIVTPVYNEQDNVESLYNAVRALFESQLTAYDFELIFTDNHSEDDTFARIRAIHDGDPRVRAYRFSRNFGYQLSILTGYRMARGDAAVQLDCDLEDPPALIVEFIRRWEQGCAVVYGVRRKRHESALKQWIRKAFYRLLAAVSSDDLPVDAGDFRLIDRRVINELAQVEDPHIYIRGRVATLGFRQQGVDYERNPRRAGKSKFKATTLLRLAGDAIVSHSVLPLRLAAAVGFFTCCLAVLTALGYTIGKIYFGASWTAGFATLVVLILAGIGLNGLFLGIIGEYLARIYQHLKNPGRVIVEAAMDADAKRP